MPRWEGDTACFCLLFSRKRGGRGGSLKRKRKSSRELGRGRLRESVTYFLDKNLHA